MSLDDKVNFFDWLNRFDAYVRRTPGRKVVLLLGNVSGHGFESCLTNV